MSGAMCLILPRQKLEDAVRRDRSIKSAFAHEEILRMVRLARSDYASRGGGGGVTFNAYPFIVI